jgi:hypothetical protein
MIFLTSSSPKKWEFAFGEMGFSSVNWVFFCSFIWKLHQKKFISKIEKIKLKTPINSVNNCPNNNRTFVIPN